MKIAGKRLSRIMAASFMLLSASVAHGDEVTNWNAILEKTVAATPHFLQSRSAAIVQLAVFEAVNAIVGDYEPHLGTIDAPPWASPEAATVAAAHRALVALHPEAAVTLDAHRADSLTAVPDGPGKDAGIAAGETAAHAVLALRADDGWDVVVPYTVMVSPGYWLPTPPDFRPAAFVGWGQVTTFAIDDGDNRWTAPDESWESFVFTPPYPSYPGNHATAAGAARAVLEQVYGREGQDITLTSQPVPSVVLHYTSWEEITDDIDDARIYGGVHFRFDQEAGAHLGRQVGTYVLKNTLGTVNGR